MIPIAMNMTHGHTTQMIIKLLLITMSCIHVTLLNVYNNVQYVFMHTCFFTHFFHSRPYNHSIIIM